jgi:hypothetical protein
LGDEAEAVLFAFTERRPLQFSPTLEPQRLGGFDHLALGKGGVEFFAELAWLLSHGASSLSYFGLTINYRVS